MLWFDKLAYSNAVDDIITRQRAMIKSLEPPEMLMFKSDHEKLEQKYLDSQRLINEYTRENDELKQEIENLNGLVTFLRKCSNKHKTDENIEIYRNNELIKENIRLRNKLVINGIKSKERERYLRAYQDLYVREVERNRDERE